MSIRQQQLLLLLSIALLPIIISGWYSLLQIDQMADEIAASTRARTIAADEHHMLEKVADIGRSIKLTVLAAELLLDDQRQILETALQGPATETAILYSQNVASSPGAVEDSRFKREYGDTPSQYVLVNHQSPSIRLTEEACASECLVSAQRLSSSATAMRKLYGGSRFSLWHYAGLENGVAMAYPGHGDYPKEYDPRQRPWYQASKNTDSTTWLPVTIDGSTGQPVALVTTALRAPDGKFVGATAIDIPLKKLLALRSSAKPWLNVSQLVLLNLNATGKLQIIAMQSPSWNRDWRTHFDAREVQGVKKENLKQILTLDRGSNILITETGLDGEAYRLALTPIDTRSESWLALASPHSAIEAAVLAALAPIEVMRQETLKRYLLGASFIALLVLVVAHYFAGWMTSPLVQISKTTAVLAGGDLSSRTGLKRGDEIGALSASIDGMADSIEALQLEQEAAYRAMILSLTRALEKKDSYTAGHSGRVSRYAVKLGRRIGLDEITMENLRYGSLVHDLGKIGVAESILNKPAPMTDEEYEFMKQHPGFSSSIMKPLVRFEEYADIAGSHHEQWNGKGYPDGLKGEEIPYLARIVAIADAWDAMTGDRVYRLGMSVEKAIDILDREKDDGQFDPALIREFIALIREESSNSDL